MGRPVDTLGDLLRPGLLAVCVGINPSLVSVAAGHYYQGRAGRRFLARLHRVGLLPDAVEGHEDDLAFAAGTGFTDVVKRPTASGKEVGADEHEHGRLALREKLVAFRPYLVVFTYKEAARRLFGDFPGNGFVPGLELAGCESFVMPGPYERGDRVDEKLDELAGWVAERRP